MKASAAKDKKAKNWYVTTRMFSSTHWTCVTRIDAGIGRQNDVKYWSKLQWNRTMDSRSKTMIVSDRYSNVIMNRCLVHALLVTTVLLVTADDDDDNGDDDDGDDDDDQL